MPADLLLLLIVAVAWATVRKSDSLLDPPVTRCDPAGHICEGRCPALPSGVSMPPDDDPSGLCLKDLKTGGCVCWLKNPSPDRHMRTLFKCEVHSQNGSTVRHVMCLPPPSCFPPGSTGCLIVTHCPCSLHRHGMEIRDGGYIWKSVVAFILRSRIPSSVTIPTREASPEKPSGDIREFSMKHLLFLLAFVIGPLLCWCLLTFFHEGKCRKKRSPPEAEPMATEQVEEEERPCAPPLPLHHSIASKCDSPPPYPEPGEDSLLPDDSGPPPSYEDAIRNQFQVVVVHGHQEMDSE